MTTAIGKGPFICYALEMMRCVQSKEVKLKYE